MLILADHQITGEILGKPFFGKTLPPAEGGALPSGIFLLHPPDKDPVFGSFVLAVRPGPGTAKGIYIKKSVQAIGAFKMAAGADTFTKRSAGADTFIKKPAGGARMVEWKMPGSRGPEATQFGEQVKPGTGEAFKVLPPGGAAQFPKMQPPDDTAHSFKMQPPGGPAEFPKMQPPGGTAGFPKKQPIGSSAGSVKILPPDDTAQFPKMQPPGGTAGFPKKQPSGSSTGSVKILPPDGTAQFPKMQPAPQHLDGAPSAVVLSQRAIPGRYCLVVVAGFADLLSALRAAGGAQILIR